MTLNQIISFISKLINLKKISGFRCACGYHNWKVLKHSDKYDQKRILEKEFNLPGRSLHTEEDMVKLYTRICIDCGKIDEQITTFYNKIKQEIIDAKQKQLNDNKKALLMYKINSIKDGLPPLEDIKV